VNKVLRLAHLYPRLMNIYGDRGNILCLRRRCEARDIELVVEEIDLGDPLEGAAYGLIFIGGGQDREQRRIAEDLAVGKGEALRQAVEDGVAMLAVCGGYQLFGRYYRTAAGDELPGVGVFDAWTVHPGEGARRCIGDVAARWEGGTLVGFENHGGRTYLGAGDRPLARVERGFGNNGEDGTEGAVRRNAYGTYLHGALLPKNPRFTDHLLRLALGRRYGEAELAPLDDSVEEAAHAAALRVARRRGAAARR
jgi:CobQ-like glutamine amidotransferase family enzyme